MGKNKRQYPNGRYVMLPPELMECQIYQTLTGKQMWVLNRFYQKVKWKERKRRMARLRLSDIRNNGKIFFTYSEAAENGILASTFSRSIKKLVELGFIDIAEPGNSLVQTPSKYSISDRWKKWGTSDFEAVKKERALPVGLGFQPGNQHNPKTKQAVTGDSSATVTADSNK